VKRTIAFFLTAAGLSLNLSACTNPYDPAQRFVGGGLLGAGAGAAIGLLLAADPGPPLVPQSAAPQVLLEALRPRRRRTATTLCIPAIMGIRATTVITGTTNSLSRG